MNDVLEFFFFLFFFLRIVIRREHRTAFFAPVRSGFFSSVLSLFLSLFPRPIWLFLSCPMLLSFPSDFCVYFSSIWRLFSADLAFSFVRSGFCFLLIIFRPIWLFTFVRFGAYFRPILRVIFVRSDLTFFFVRSPYHFPRGSYTSKQHGRCGMTTACGTGTLASCTLRSACFDSMS